MAFSGAVKLGDLNDFIAPSQACVVNLAPNSKLGPVDLQVRVACPLLITLSETQSFLSWAYLMYQRGKA